MIAEKNTTAKTQYLILGSSVTNASAFGNGTAAAANQIHLKKLTPDSVQKLGEGRAWLTILLTVPEPRVMPDSFMEVPSVKFTSVMALPVSVSSGTAAWFHRR